jgi:hypothetical protein
VAYWSSLAVIKAGSLAIFKAGSLAVIKAGSLAVLGITYAFRKRRGRRSGLASLETGQTADRVVLGGEFLLRRRRELLSGRRELSPSDQVAPTKAQNY